MPERGCHSRSTKATGWAGLGAGHALPARHRCPRDRLALLRESAQRAARLSRARRLSASATVQAFATSFMRLARPTSGFEPDRLQPDRVKYWLCPVEGVAWSGREHDEPTLRGRLPGAEHGTVHERDPMVLREAGHALGVCVHAGLEPDGAVRHRLRRLPHP